MDFLSFSMNYWEDLWQSRHHVMSRLAARHKVLFVSPPAHVREVLGAKWKRLPQSGLQERSANLFRWFLRTSFLKPTASRRSIGYQPIFVKRRFAISFESWDFSR